MGGGDRKYAVLTAVIDGSGFPDGLVLYSMAWGFTAGRTGRLAFLCCTRAGSSCMRSCPRTYISRRPSYESKPGCDPYGSCN